MCREHLGHRTPFFRLAIWPVMDRHRITNLADACRTMAETTVCAETRETLYSIAADLEELAALLTDGPALGGGEQIIRLRRN